MSLVSDVGLMTNQGDVGVDMLSPLDMMAEAVDIGSAELDMTPSAVDADGLGNDAHGEAVDAGANVEGPDGFLPDMGPAAPAVVALDGSGDYLDLASALAAQETDILVMPGDYVVDSAIEFATPGTTVRGENRETVRFIQSNRDADLFVVRADDVTISNLTLDTVMAGQAAFVEQAANRVTLEDSLIFGGSQIFTIYFAGPNVEAGRATIDAFENQALSRGNRLLRNEITTSFVGDSVAFALQADGEVRDNVLNGGMLSMYMLQNVVCEGNSVLNSPTNGIFISLPSTDSVVTNNVVRNSLYAAIVVKPQVEHEAAGRLIDSRGVVISGNTLTAQYSIIEVDGTGVDPSQGQLVNLLIEANTIELDDFAGVYLLRANGPILRENRITFTGADVSRRGQEGRLAIIDSFSAGVYADFAVTDAIIEGNTITRTANVDDPRVMQNAIVLNDPSVSGATIRQNTFQRFGDDWVHSPCGDAFGDSDQDGVFDRTGSLHRIEANECQVEIQ